MDHADELRPAHSAGIDPGMHRPWDVVIEAVTDEPGAALDRARERFGGRAGLRYRLVDGRALLILDARRVLGLGPRLEAHAAAEGLRLRFVELDALLPLGHLDDRPCLVWLRVQTAADTLAETREAPTPAGLLRLVSVEDPDGQRLVADGRAVPIEDPADDEWVHRTRSGMALEPALPHGSIDAAADSGVAASLRLFADEDSRGRARRPDLEALIPSEVAGRPLMVTSKSTVRFDALPIARLLEVRGVDPDHCGVATGMSDDVAIVVSVYGIPGIDVSSLADIVREVGVTSKERFVAGRSVGWKRSGGSHAIATFLIEGALVLVSGETELVEAVIGSYPSPAMDHPAG